MQRRRPVMLVILDGWGFREETADNAVRQARTPSFDRLWRSGPHGFLRTSAKDVGLPDGQMGNSEVGHLNIGAGRVVMQDLPRIDAAIASGEIKRAPALIELIKKLKDSGGTCHLLGLVSPGGVHSHQDHATALARILTDAGVPAENRLFVTLDPRTRQLALPGGETVLVTDTVGFVRKLPHELVEAFRSTLDSVRLADLVVHVVDGTAANAEAQMAAVREVLGEIGAADVPELTVVNKADQAPDEAKALAHGIEGSVLISARTGEGVEELLRVLADRLRGSDRVVQLLVPWSRGDVLAAVHREGEVISQSDGEEGATLQVVLDDVGRARFAQYMTAPCT